VQFNVIEKSGTTPPASEKGWKDVVLVMPQDSVKFITKFETFANSTTPYMYHCHLLHHEDDGMMGSFIVKDDTHTGICIVSDNVISVSPNPTDKMIRVMSNENNNPYTLEIVDVTGKESSYKSIRKGIIIYS
jgi:bilirubin oxidase